MTKEIQNKLLTANHGPALDAKEDLPLCELLTTAEAAFVLGVAPQTLRKWRCEGRGPAYVRLGTGVRARAHYRRSDIDDWIRAHRFANTSQETVIYERRAS